MRRIFMSMILFTVCHTYIILLLTSSVGIFVGLTTPPLTLYQIFNRETIAKVRIQLEVARKLASNPLAYQVVEVTNGRFCQLPVPAQK